MVALINMPEASTDYLSLIQLQHDLGFFRPRRFQTADDHDRFAALSFRTGTFGDRNPGLESVLDNSAVVVLAEPGAGKSTIASAAVRLALEKRRLPLYVPLRNYRDNLVAAATPSPAGALDPDCEWLLVLDGLDEMPETEISALLAELKQHRQERPDDRFLLTSRQAFFVARNGQLALPWPVYYLEDLSAEDIDAFARYQDVDPSAFADAVASTSLFNEVGNPFLLQALLRQFRDQGILGPTRSDAVRSLVDATLAARPTSRPDRQRRALRMLAVAMEAACRNDLSRTEAVLVLKRALHLTAGEAEALLLELTASILVLNGDRIAFQMRSFGEYLAAEDLADLRETDRLMTIMRLPESLVLNDSWRNCAGYLAEQHRGFRRALARDRPDWVMVASPSVFTDTEREAVARAFLDLLTRQRVHIAQYHIVPGSAVRLGRLVTEELLRELHATDGADLVTASNALVARAAASDATAAGQALEWALDTERDQNARSAGLVALELLSDDSAVEPLLAAASLPDPLSISLIDAAAAIMTPGQLGKVLTAANQHSGTILSGLYRRVSDFRSPNEVKTALEAVASTGSLDARSLRYLSSLWRRLPDLWTPELADVLCQIIVAVADGDHERLDDALVDALERLADGGRAVGRCLLDKLQSDPALARALSVSAFDLIHVDDVRPVVELLHPDLKQALRVFGRPEVRAILMPTDSLPAHELSPEFIAWREREASRQSFRDTQRAAAMNAVEPQALLEALGQIDKDDWPDLDAAQRNLLAGKLDDLFARMNLPASIRWQSEHRWTMPSVLPLCLRLLNRYEIRLDDDTPLVWALTAREHDSVIRYHRRWGLSQRAWELIDRLLAEGSVGDQPLDGILRLVLDSGEDSGGRIQALCLIATGERAHSTRWLAVQILTKAGDSGALLGIAEHLVGDLRAMVEGALVARGDRGTIERKLATLLASPELLDAADISTAFENPLSWLDSVTLPAVWSTLVQLRRVAIRRSLPHVSGRITEVLKRIDPIRLADVIERQIQDCPADWQSFERIRALECRREGAIRQGQGVPFEDVLRRMRQVSTLNRFKIVVDGPNDVGVLETLVGKMPEDSADFVVVRPVGGWAAILAGTWRPEQLLDGCDGILVLLDGDRAMDWTGPKKQLRQDVRRALARMRGAGIEYVILEWYAIENYFSRQALESVLGPLDDSLFPLDPERSVEAQVPRFQKRRGPEVAQAMRLEDFDGTDLGRFLQMVQERARVD